MNAQIKLLTNRLTRDEGWALVSVLWVVAILSMLAVAVQLLVVTAARAEARLLERAQLEAALDAAVSRAVVGITDARVDQRWKVNGSPERFRFSGLDIVVKVQDESGKIDINASDVSLIGQLLQSSGATPELASQISSRIVFWRGNSHLKDLAGNSDDDYAAAGKSYRPRHGPFQTIEEARLVLGMTDSLFTNIKSAITVFTNRPMFDPTLAPLQVRAAISEDKPSAPSDSSSDDDDTAGKLDPSLSVGGQTFTISAQANGNSMHMSREAVVTLTGNDKHPFIVRWWK